MVVFGMGASIQTINFHIFPMAQYLIHAHLLILMINFISNSKELMEYYNYYDFFVGFLIPLTLIITLNTVTAFAVWKPSKVGRTVNVKSYNRYSFSYVFFWKLFLLFCFSSFRFFSKFLWIANQWNIFFFFGKSLICIRIKIIR